MEYNLAEYSDIGPLFYKGANPPPPPIPLFSSDAVVIYPPTIDWSWMKQRPQHLMEQFSLLGCPVYYCNMTQSKTELYTEINPNLILIHNNRSFVKNIVPLLKQKRKKILLWVSWSKLQAFLDEYMPDFIVYDYLDDFPAWRPYFKAMVDAADLVTTTSVVLQGQIETQFPQKPHFLIPNGCDLEHFKKGASMTKPREFSGHKGPVITYSGAWAKWLDHALVSKIAAAFPSALVAIVGVEFGSTVGQGVPNLKYLGYKSYGDLPAYLHHSTLCLIPFLIEEITVATNPVKMYEYLASGKPVVSTDIPEARGVPSVFVGESHEAFLEKIGRILKGELVYSQPEADRWLAARTWTKRAERALELIADRGFPLRGKPPPNSFDKEEQDTVPN